MSTEKVLRNRELLRMWLSGEYSNNDLAEKFNISPGTVSNIVKKFFNSGNPNYENLDPSMDSKYEAATRPATTTTHVGVPIKILYTNWRGETSWRTIIPKGLKFGSTSWHPEDQWLLDAHDVDKNEERTFALLDIHKMEAVRS